MISENDSGGSRATITHLQTQNLRLRSGMSEYKNKVNELETEIGALQDHVTFLRHISEPNTDAGALDMSLAILRGHELEKSRSSLAESSKTIAALQSSRDQLQLDLDSERQVWIQKETSIQSEVNRLQLYLSRVGALHQSNESTVENYKSRISHLIDQHNESTATLKADHESCLKQALENQAIKFSKELTGKVAQNRRLEQDKQDLQDTLNSYAEKFNQQENNLELAWAHARGMESTSDNNEKTVELEQQILTLQTNFEQERIVLKRQVSQLTSLVCHTANSTTDNCTQTAPAQQASISTQTVTLDDELTNRLSAYHAQLKRATTELKRASMDNRNLFLRYLASQAARVGLSWMFRRQQGPAPMANLALMWEEQAVKVEAELEMREKQLVFEQACSTGALRSLNRETLAMEARLKLCRSTMEQNENQLRLEYSKKLKTLESKVRDLVQDKRVIKVEIEKYRQEVQTANEKFSVLEADLAIAENEVSRLSTELSRRNAADKKPREKKQPIDSEREKWEKEKQTELLNLQKHYAESFKSQIATLLSSKKVLEVDRESFAFESQPVKKQPIVLGRKRVQLSSPLKENLPPTVQWSPEASYQRWVQRQSNE